MDLDNGIVTTAGLCYTYTQLHFPSLVSLLDARARKGLPCKYTGYVRGTWIVYRIAGHGRPDNMHQNCIVSMLARQKACSATTRILQGFAPQEHLVVQLKLHDAKAPTTVTWPS